MHATETAAKASRFESMTRTPQRVPEASRVPEPRRAPAAQTTGEREFSRTARRARLSHRGESVLPREQRRKIVHMRTSTLAVALFAAAMLAVPSTVSAITADQVVEMTTGGVS